MFYLTDSFVILSSLLLFILPVALGNGAVLVRAGKGIEYPDVEVCPLPVSSPKVLCDDAPSSRFAVLWKSRSSVTGCRCGSVPTPWQTSVSRCAVISLISLCLIEGKPPLWQLRAWSTVNLLPQAQWEGTCVLVAIHSVGRVRRGMHPCGVRSHVLGWVVWRASLKRPFLLKSSSILEGLQGVFLKFLMPLIFRIVFAGIELIFFL